MTRLDEDNLAVTSIPQKTNMSFSNFRLHCMCVVQKNSINYLLQHYLNNFICTWKPDHVSERPTNEKTDSIFKWPSDTSVKKQTVCVIRLITMWRVFWVTDEQTQTNLSTPTEPTHWPVKVYFHSVVWLRFNHPLAVQRIFVKRGPTRGQKNPGRSCEVSSTWSYGEINTQPQGEQINHFNSILAWAKRSCHIKFRDW